MIQELRNQIEDFYLPRQLVEAILEVGGIPRDSEEVEIGVGFIDIADYTFLSKFLTPKENQEVLNGLYTAFNGVLRRHGGYLNKIEGDSLMFHYGGIIDPIARKISDRRDLRLYIARELFFTCVEMQRVSLRFNNADRRFLEDAETEVEREALEKAFKIIARLREDDAVSNPLNAMFQIRIRVGANLGEVTIGNFGPEGARQWDVIGMPVIDAKRMETTAPVGGVRISRTYYNILEEHGFVDEYFERFRREARALGGRYAEITRDELFQIKRVSLREKGNAFFETCSIQVNPALPEQIAQQVRALLTHGRFGAVRIVELLKYYRGNEYVTDAIEDALITAGVRIRYADSFQLMYPNRYDAMLDEHSGDRQKIEELVSRDESLYGLMTKLGRYQDIVKQGRDEPEDQLSFSTYDRHFSVGRTRRQQYYEEIKALIAQRAYFFNVVFPLVFESILAAVLEYQTEEEDLEMLES